jgi:uncharacterized protein (TIGR02757 family)
MKKLNQKEFELREIKSLLDEKYHHYNRISFIENDPVSIPHFFSRKEDIEIAGFLAATISWGNRKSIISNSVRLMKLMDDSPYDFIVNHQKKDLGRFDKFVHRTFNSVDCVFFIQSLQNIYRNRGGLEKAFMASRRKKSAGIKNNIVNFRTAFLEQKHLVRSEKHISDPQKKSSAKRICMFLRWMVRKDKHGVDFGIWKSISPADLCLPLDVHTGNVARSLGLLLRKQNDWQAVEEITQVLRSFDKNDPVKYDFALFGMGVNKDLKYPDTSPV